MAYQNQGYSITFHSWTLKIKSWQGPDAQVEALDITGIDDTHEVFMPSRLRKHGDITLTVYHNPALSDPTKLAEDEFVITYPNGAAGVGLTTCTFDGFVTDYKLKGGDVKATPEADIVIKVNSEPVYGTV